MKATRVGRPPAPPSDDDQTELAARHSADMAKLERSQRDELRAMESRHRIEVLSLERVQVIEQLDLWKRQGRRLGPGPLALLEGRAGR